MGRLADIAQEGRECLLARDYRKLGELIDENFDTRARMVPLDPRNVEMVMVSRRLGAPAHYAGSGGSILGIYEDETQLARLEAEFAGLGCLVIRPIVA